MVNPHRRFLVDKLHDTLKAAGNALKSMESNDKFEAKYWLAKVDSELTRLILEDISRNRKDDK